MSEINTNKKVTFNDLLGSVNNMSNKLCNKIELLPHNQMLYDKIVAEIEKGEHSIFYSEATGLGKSFIFMRLVQDYFTNKKILYVVPKIAVWKNLIQYKEFKWLNADIVMTTYTAFNTLDENKYSNYDAIFIDECHHMITDIQGTNIMTLCDIFKRQNKYVFGFTATPYYQGSYVDEQCFDVSCYGYDVYEAIDRGILPKIKLALANIDINSIPDNVKTQFSITGTKSLLELIVNEHPEIHRWLAYFANSKELEIRAHELACLFPDYKILKTYVGQENDDYVFDEFNDYSGKVILLSVNRLLEGIHLKNVQGVLLYRNVVEMSTYMQMYGRLCDLNSKVTPLFLDVTNAIISLRGIGETKSKRHVGERKIYNRRDLFDITAKDYWTVELADIMSSLNGGNWRDDELEIIRMYYRKISMKELLDKLPGRTVLSIRLKASQMGVTGNKPWTEEEDRILLENTELSHKQLEILLPNRNWQAIKRRRSIIGVAQDAHIVWTEEELNILKRCDSLTRDELQELLPNRTMSAIDSMRKKLGYAPPKPNANSGTHWDESELQILRDNYPSLGSKCFSLLPNRTKAQCANMVFKMGLKREQREDSLLWDYISKYYHIESNKVIANKFNVSVNVVQKIAAKQGLTTQIGPKIEWTDEMDKFLIDNVQTMRRVDIANHLGVTVSSIGHRIEKLGIKHRDWAYWSDDEIERLKQLYTDGKSISEMSELLGRASSSVAFKLKTLGFK